MKSTSWADRLTGAQWNLIIALRLTAACFVTILGLLLLSPPIVTGVGDSRLVPATAAYISQKRVEQFMAAIQFKVRFTTTRGVHVTTYVYPNYGTSPVSHGQVPIRYSTIKPRNAYYAGPGGDAYEPTNPLALIIFSSGVAAIGIWMIFGALSWQRRIITLARTGSEREPYLSLCWQLRPKKGQQIVIATDGRQLFTYSWKVIPLGARITFSRKLVKYFLTPWPSVDPTFSTQTWPDTAQSVGALHPHCWVLFRSAGQLFLPLTRGEPVIECILPGISNSRPREIDLLYAHQQLLGAYAVVLNNVRQLPVFVRPPGRQDAICRFPRLRTLLCWRPLVRLHVESHIRRQLRQLASAYIRQQFIPEVFTSGSQTEPHDFSALRADCELLTASLSDVRRPIASIVVGLTILVPLIPVILRTHPLGFGLLVEELLHYTYLAITFSPALIALTAYVDAFRCKRHLFGANNMAQMKAHRGENTTIYSLEDDLFRIIGQRKSTERAVDLWACGAVLTAWAIAATVALVITPSGFGFRIIIAIIIGFPLWLLIAAIRRRAYGER
jgi:hypothetical protein